MEDKTMKSIVEMSAGLDQKQTWVKKGFAEMMEKINKVLAGQTIATVDENIEFFIRSWENNDGLTRKVTLDLDVDKAGLELILRLGKQDYEGSWDWERLEKPSLETIKIVAAKMPEILAYYTAELEKMNDLEAATVSAMQNIMAKFSGA